MCHIYQYNVFMTNYIKRLIFVDDAETIRVNPLFYAFMLGTLFYGLGFLAFGWTAGVSASSLFQALEGIHHWLPTVWGIAALSAGLLAFYCILTRQIRVSSPLTAMLGFSVWLFAGFCYLQTGAWLLVFTVAGPYGFFWCYWYFRLKWYMRQKAKGLKDVD